MNKKNYLLIQIRDNDQIRLIMKLEIPLDSWVHFKEAEGKKKLLKNNWKWKKRGEWTAANYSNCTTRKQQVSLGQKENLKGGTSSWLLIGGCATLLPLEVEEKKIIKIKG